MSDEKRVTCTKCGSTRPITATRPCSKDGTPHCLDVAACLAARDVALRSRLLAAERERDHLKAKADELMNQNISCEMENEALLDRAEKAEAAAAALREALEDIEYEGPDWRDNLALHGRVIEMLSSPDAGRGWASPETVRLCRGALECVTQCCPGDFTDGMVRHDERCAVLAALDALKGET